MQNCSTCGANQWSLQHRVKPLPEETLPEETLYAWAKTGLMPPEMVHHAQQQCLACHNWQDVDLPEGWKTRAAHATIYVRTPDRGGFRFLRNYSFKTIAREYNHSRRLVVEWIEKYEGYQPGYVAADKNEYRIEVKHSSWLNKASYEYYYHELDGWQKEKNQKRKEKAMVTKSTMKRSTALGPITPVVGGLYEAVSGTCKYIVLCTDVSDARVTTFEGVVVWAEEDAKWGVGKMFRDCSRTGYIEFTGSITLANLDD